MASILKEQINLRHTGPGTYTASWHVDWTNGPTLHGGCVAAIIHHAAETHLATDPKLKAKNQPDIISLHLEFLRPCTRQESTISVTTIRAGAATSTIQLALAQGGSQTKVLASATCIDFSRSLGPSVPVPVTRALCPPPARPAPDFAAVLAHKPDPNWRRIVALDPRGGFPRNDGVCDAWNGLLLDENEQQIDGTYLALMSDIIPSMSDTLTHNGGLYDAHTFYARAADWAERNPGKPAILENTVAEALKTPIFNSTVTLDIEFARRIEKEEGEKKRFVFTRTVANYLEGGRMGVDVTVCDEDMHLLCTAHQLILVLGTERKFADPEGKGGKGEGEKRKSVL
ncbi:thioesterase-like superfamily-domain-containing protein [Xylariaceae sp. FL0594]|nr:thioesterase-like superfamily-domain-containing protein [Xylariaceae sp. FL0594]